MANFILERMKEKFGGDDEEDKEKGFPDMNYLIGNSSAMDVGEVPTPMDQRIGYAAQVGGSVMELQITNPATFTLERDSMISTIHQLGLDITTHPDMNAGFCTAEKSARGEEYGYDTTEQYFTNYLQELAQFKKHVEKMGKDDEPLFNIGRMNPHISTSPMPALEERMANDVGLDPFGYEINKYDEDSIKKRNYRGENIYKNPEFLRKLYHTLFLEISNYPFQQYQSFSTYSDTFDIKWRKSQHEAAKQLFHDEADDISDKLGTILTGRRQDQGVGRKWLEILDQEIELEVAFPILAPDIERDDQGNPTTYNGVIQEEITSLKQLLTQRYARAEESPPPLQRMDNVLYQIESLSIDDLAPFNQIPEEYRERFRQDVASKVDIKQVRDSTLNAIGTAFDKLWDGKSPDPEDQYMSQDAKWSGLQSHLEIQQIRLLENAYKIGKNEYNIEEEAATVFAGKDLSKFDASDREDMDEEDMHEDLLERILQGQQFQREMWKESIIFYLIIPAWMSSSDEVENDDHEGWDAPRFIWESIVEERWGDRDDVNLDLENPRNGVYEDKDDDDKEDVYHYLDLLEDNPEFQRDVAAAVGACYCWAHFTQRKAKFDLKGRDFGLSDDEVEEVQNEGWTWVEWMNRFGIGVNLETMAGSPQMRFKVWRPKDIAVAAHAINLTTRRMFEENGELGGLEELNDEIDGRPAKFTIDMEHVASLGAPPLDEMERFFEMEEYLADSDWALDIDSEKPVANILRQMHLMDPGVEGQRGTHHGAFERGNELLYKWLYRFVDNGFTRNENEPSTILFELAEHKAESSYMMRLTMNLIEIGVTPEELDPSNVTPGEEPEDEREAMIARFFGMEQANYSREWAKIEEHAFDPLKGLLEAEEFDYTFSSKAAVDQGQNRPQEWQGEEYQ
ncbi:hypothetical protein [Candidatus Nanohalobium constans]|uniref:Uncharacterized protein n=1 Tax=Candidatus Nanohalobium constans TaxID=2565781 RepID=A0A5Q0UGB5_9ARCH|nr:hypothetical protein [Candidatus Nanohalobium constans]QGA80693.1 hypothetical protein LC1Nh_0809 [Candidatus Nanohalobium constans]